MIATGTAIALAAAASAAGGIASAKIKSNAANKAAQQQVAASNNAQQYIQQGMGQLGQLYSPYINNGAQAANLMGRLTTPGVGARFASNGPPNATPQMPPAGVSPNYAVQSGQAPPIAPGYTGYGYGAGSPVSAPMGGGYGQPIYSGGTFSQLHPNNMQSGLRQPQ